MYSRPIQNATGLNDLKINAAMKYYAGFGSWLSPDVSPIAQGHSDLLTYTILAESDSIFAAFSVLFTFILSQTI